MISIQGCMGALLAVIIMALAFVLGACAGQWDTFRVVRRRDLQRELDAKRCQLDAIAAFDLLDIPDLPEQAAAQVQRR